MLQTFKAVPMHTLVLQGDCPLAHLPAFKLKNPLNGVLVHIEQARH
jgi:hypothetical protein